MIFLRGSFRSPLILIKKKEEKYVGKQIFRLFSSEEKQICSKLINSIQKNERLFKAKIAACTNKLSIYGFSIIE